MTAPGPEPLGVVLAGGQGLRIGGSKALVELRGLPLISYPLRALAEALEDVAVIAKADTALPALPGVTVWIEASSVRHPVMGIVQALSLAEGRPVLICAVDLPFVTPELITQLADSDPQSAPAVIASRHGTTQPLLGCYQPTALEPLIGAAEMGERRARELVAAIGPRELEVEDPAALFNINAPDDLLQAAAMMDARPQV